MPSERIFINYLISHLEDASVPKENSLRNLIGMVSTEQTYFALGADTLIGYFKEEAEMKDKVDAVLVHGVNSSLAKLHTSLGAIFFIGLTQEKKEKSEKDMVHIKRTVANCLVRGIATDAYFVTDDIIGKGRRDFELKCEKARKMIEDEHNVPLKIQDSAKFQVELRNNGMYAYSSPFTS